MQFQMQELFVTKEGIILYNPIRNEKLLIMTNSELDKVTIKAVEGECDPNLFLVKFPSEQITQCHRKKSLSYKSMASFA